MLKCERVESERARAMMASKYLYFFMEVLLLDKHPCLARSYMLDEQGHVFVVRQNTLLSAPPGHILRRSAHLNNSQDGHRTIWAKRRGCPNTFRRSLARSSTALQVLGVSSEFFETRFLSDQALGYAGSGPWGSDEGRNTRTRRPASALWLSTIRFWTGHPWSAGGPWSPGGLTPTRISVRTRRTSSTASQGQEVSR